MHTSKNDYLINTLRFVSAKEATQIYGAILPESFTSPEMKETNAYKTYLGFATGATPPKKVRKFKKTASPQLTIVPVSPKETSQKSKRVKRSAKKSSEAPAGGVVIRETPEMPLSKKKEKGNDEDESNNEQDSRSEGSDEENDSDDKNTQSDSKKGSDSEHETDENESDSKSDQDKNEEEIGDDEEEEDEFFRTSSNDFDDKTKISDKAECSVSSILVGILPLTHSSPSYLRTAISNYGVSL
nr:hypothetical protein [Tanacetum cinerariifolium]